MKFSLYRSLVFLVAITLLIAPTKHPLKSSTSPTRTLNSAIRETLNIPDNTPITQQEILQLTDS